MISVIIPVYQRLDLVAACVASLRACAASSSIEFVLQIDPSGDLLPHMGIPGAEIAENPTRLGFSGTCNAGAARASGSTLFFVNQDVFAVQGLSESWDAALLEAMEDAHTGAAGLQLLTPSGAIQNDGGGIDAKGQPFHWRLGEARRPTAAGVRPVSWTTGAALAVRASLFDGFDVAYKGGYFEDVDLCCRLRSKGFQITLNDRAPLVHRVGSCGGTEASQYERNALLFRSRWREKVSPDVHRVMAHLW